jgi:hypothetical protein
MPDLSVTALSVASFQKAVATAASSVHEIRQVMRT